MAGSDRGIVVMGVSGSGKTTVGRAVAERLDRPYIEADAHHPPANVAKMSAGQPLTDADRWPWLAALNEELRSAPRSVVSCSALRRAYREALVAGVAPTPRVVHLAAAYDELRGRVESRADHFMPAGLLRSQFDAMEWPADEEQVLTLDAMRPVAELVDAVEAEVG